MSTEPLPNPAPEVPADEPAVEAVAADTPSDAVAEPAPAAAAPAVPEMSLGACSRELAKRFPLLFGPNPKPIKLRIQADIQQRVPGVFSKKILSIFLHRHTTQTAYLVALSKSKERFDLDGLPAGELAEEHRAAAVEELKRRRAVHEQKRAAEDEVRRQRFSLLRDFERTTLTRANFCALKGVAEAELDGLLATIRTEMAEWEAKRPPRPEGRPEGRRDARGPGRGEGRGDGRGEGRPGPRREARGDARPPRGGPGRGPRREG